MDLLVQPSDLETLGEEDLDEPQANLLLEQASALVRRYCDWSITREEQTFVLDGDRSTLLFLPTLHLVEVTEVRVGGTPWLGAFSWSTNGTVEATGCWPRGRRNIALDVVHGYLETPGDVSGVVVAVALRAHLNPAGATSDSFAGSTTAWSTGFGLTAQERQTLDRYRIVGQP